MNERKVFKNSVTELPAEPGPTPHGLMVAQAKPENRNEKMDLLFSLAMPAMDELEKRVAAGEVVPQSDLNQKYSPKKADVDALKTWLTTQGFHVTGESPDGSGIYASATVGQIEQSLAVKMVRVTKNGITYTAAQNAPSLPTAVGEPVHAILGLQPFRHAHKHRARPAITQNRGSLGPNGLPVPNVANTPPYLVSEILKAYNAGSLGVTGKGQTIAILIDTFPHDDDLVAFWKANGIPVDLNRIQRVQVGTGRLPPREGEETLDASWASGIAPGAKVKIYASGSLAFAALNRALDRIIQDAANDPTLKQVSVSLGLGETFMAPDDVTTQHQRFLKLAAAGVNVFVSSGDAGSNPDGSGQNSGGPLQAEYAASDPAVVGVGGTSLKLAVAGGSVAEEDAWIGSGGGDSSIFPRPIWQKGTGVPPENHRSVPDVSSVAAPETGAFLVFQGHPFGVLGGTSWSAPTWAGFCALINEARQNAGLPALSFLNPKIYPLVGTRCFRDIATGSNGQYSAGPGHDRVTGLGVPNVAQLITALTGADKPAVVAAA
ncbi:MAG TPA: S53 family peptidase [Xanthobacteraceae bacterium]